MSTPNVQTDLLLITIKQASACLSISPKTARDWLWKNKFPVPTVKVHGKRLVPYMLLREYVDGLVSAELNKIQNH